MRLKVEASGLAPEEVLVLETAGPVEDFIVAVRHTKGMEWLAEIEDDCIPPDDDFFSLNKKGEALPGKTLRGRVFLVFTNQRALHELLSLWERWCHGQPFARGKTKWSDVFAQLRDIRPWDVRDRLIETHALEDWEDSIENGAESIRCEIELWFRQESTSRELATGYERLAILDALQGSAEYSLVCPPRPLGRGRTDDA